MKVQTSDEHVMIAVSLDGDERHQDRVILTPQAAIDLARDLIDAVTQRGFEVKMTVDVPRHQPTPAQIAHAVVRVGHLRKTLDGSAPWNSDKVNRELVMRVLEACL